MVINLSTRPTKKIKCEIYQHVDVNGVQIFKEQNRMMRQITTVENTKQVIDDQCISRKW
jgi:hypothetical protein